MLVQIPSVFQDLACTQYFYSHHSVTLIFDPITLKMSSVSSGPGRCDMNFVKICPFRRWKKRKVLVWAYNNIEIGDILRQSIYWPLLDIFPKSAFLKYSYSGQVNHWNHTTAALAAQTVHSTDSRPALFLRYSPFTVQCTCLRIYVYERCKTSVNYNGIITISSVRDNAWPWDIDNIRLSFMQTNRYNISLLMVKQYMNCG